MLLSLWLPVRRDYSRVLFSSWTIWSAPSESEPDEKFSAADWKISTFFQAVAGDDLDVDVLGNGGEGDLEATDGGGVSRLHLGKPASPTRRVLTKMFNESSTLLYSWSPGLPRKQRACWSGRDGGERPLLFFLHLRSRESSCSSKLLRPSRLFRWLSPCYLRRSSPWHFLAPLHCHFLGSGSLLSLHLRHCCLTSS